MSLIPEPPEIYRYGARRRGGITVEPVWIRWQGSSVGVFTGNGGVIAEFNIWDLSPLSDPTRIGSSEFQEVGDEYIASGRAPGSLDYFDIVSFSETINGNYSEVCTFLVDNNLFYVQSRMKHVWVEGQYNHAYWHGGNPGATPPYSDAGHYGHGEKDFYGTTAAMADVLVVKINIDDGSVTSTSQVCYTMEVALNYVDWGKFNYDMSHSSTSVIGFLSSATGLSTEHFVSSHSTGANWETNNSTWTQATTSTPSFEDSKDEYYYMTGLPWSASNSTYFRIWSQAGVARTNDRWRYPSVHFWMPVERFRQAFAASVWEERFEDGTYQEYQKGEFFELPRWSGIDTVNGVVSSTFDNIRDITGYPYVYSECLVEVSSFIADPGNSSLSGFAGIGHSEFSGAYANLLLDNESDVDYEIDTVGGRLKAAIEGPLRATNCSYSAHDYDGSSHPLIDDRPNFYGYFANPQVWLEPMADSRPETSDPQYFWSNLQGAMFHMPNALNGVHEADGAMHYRISV